MVYSGSSPISVPVDDVTGAATSASATGRGGTGSAAREGWACMGSTGDLRGAGSEWPEQYSQ